MNDPAVSKWKQAVVEAQPGASLAFLIYVRDGQVWCDHERKTFPNEDLEIARRLVDEQFEKFLDALVP